MKKSLWNQCINRLESRFPETDINTWIRPIEAVQEGASIKLMVPNAVVKERVDQAYLEEIRNILSGLCDDDPKVEVRVGSAQLLVNEETEATGTAPVSGAYDNKLNPLYTFENFVIGKSNQIARAAAEQVASGTDMAYNPLLVYGGTGLGKTHLMHSLGNRMLEKQRKAKVIYIRAEKFVTAMVTALRFGRMDEFKQTYRSVDALLIDDIQFFAGKERSQEELFHTLNSLLEESQQIVLTCDRLPQEVEGLEDRLKSRFSWGLSVSVEPPDLETRAAILISKAGQAGVELPQEVAFFIAQRVRSNVRQLEGALNNLLAAAQFSGQQISIEFAAQALQGLLSAHAKLITLDTIQKTVADYYNMSVSNLNSKRRSRSIARPRQIAMSLAKELTEHSYPEIGSAFGGRDHTTVMHAFRTIQDLRRSDNRIAEDYKILSRTLST